MYKLLSIFALVIASEAFNCGNPCSNPCPSPCQAGGPGRSIPPWSFASISPGSMELSNMQIPSGASSYYQEPDTQMQMSSMQMPSMQMPNMQMPSMQIPNMQMPSMQMPSMQMSSMQMPNMQIPNMQMPSMQIPSMQIPSMQMPSMQTPVMQTMGMSGMQIPNMQMTGMQMPMSSMSTYSGMEGMPNTNQFSGYPSMGYSGIQGIPDMNNMQMTGYQGSQTGSMSGASSMANGDGVSGGYIYSGALGQPTKVQYFGNAMPNHPSMTPINGLTRPESYSPFGSNSVTSNQQF